MDVCVYVYKCVCLYVCDIDVLMHMIEQQGKQ